MASTSSPPALVMLGVFAIRELDCSVQFRSICFVRSHPEHRAIETPRWARDPVDDRRRRPSSRELLLHVGYPGLSLRGGRDAGLGLLRLAANLPARRRGTEEEDQPHGLSLYQGLRR